MENSSPLRVAIQQCDKTHYGKLNICNTNYEHNLNSCSTTTSTSQWKSMVETRRAWKIRKDVNSDSALGQVLWMEVSEAVRGLRGVTVI